MFGELLESKARKQRRSMGATLSIAVHVAIIGAVAVRTVQGKSAPPERTQPIFLQIAPPKPTVVHQQTRSAPANAVPSLPSDIVIKHIDPPTVIPTDLPPIDMSGSISADSIVIGGGKGATTSFGDKYAADAAADNRDWDVHELLMHVITPAKPRYPEALRGAGVDGHVLVQFSVDTTGRVDLTSVKVLESTHDLFTRSVRDALADFRFRPAQVAGRHVSALAQMPFEFHITR